MNHVLPKILFLLFAARLVTTVCSGQALGPESFKGKVRLVTYVREVWIVGGRNVPPQPAVISRSEFGTDGRIIQSSFYGNIERRTKYGYKDGVRTESYSYFDPSGNPIAADNAKFEPAVDVAYQNDLCPDYSIKTEKDKAAGIEHITETCTTGERRAITKIERNADSTYVRELREDAKGRTYETIAVFSSKDVVKEFRYLVNNLKLPKYSFEIKCVNHEFDSKGNLIKVICSATHSSRPYQVAGQYAEKFEFTYFD